MSATFTLAQMRTAIQDWTNNVHADMLDYLNETGLQNAESRILRDLDLELFMSSASISITNNSNSVTKPTGTVSAEYLMILRSGQTRWDLIQRRTRDFCRWVATTATGTPKYFCDFSTTAWFIAPTPANSYASPNAIAIIVTRPTSLITDTGGTFLSDNFGDMLFWATAMEMQSYQKNPSKIKEALELYASLMPAARAEVDVMERVRYADVGSIAGEQLMAKAAADAGTSQ